MIEFRKVRGHIEVYVDDMFLFSADTMKEAKEELNETLAEARVRVMQPRVNNSMTDLGQARVNAESAKFILIEDQVSERNLIGS